MLRHHGIECSTRACLKALFSGYICNHQTSLLTSRGSLLNVVVLSFNRLPCYVVGSSHHIPHSLIFIHFRTIFRVCVYSKISLPNFYISYTHPLQNFILFGFFRTGPSKFPVYSGSKRTFRSAFPLHGLLLRHFRDKVCRKGGM